MYLMHHGVKGMKWGVRRYQNPDGTLTDAGRKRYERAIKRESAIAKRDEEPISDEVRLVDSYAKSGIIPKGVKVYRSTTDNDKFDNRRKYVSLTTEGRDDFQNMFLEGALATGGRVTASDLVNVEYETIKNLKVASNEQVDSFIASMRPDTVKYKTVLRDLENLERLDQVAYYKIKRPTKAAKEAREYMSSARKYLADARHKALMSTKYDEDNPVFKHFMDLGYDAIPDVEDGGLGNNNGLAPAIILNPSNSVKETVRYKF